ncbi:cytochrome b/b6 domain-containing protein [Aurantimonas sp. Leaf443]|uniref:cytochrome b n=1 Tax=Aurantimonas sp. Leaf443 TaxID=1736378 RepID=UPI0006F54F45|nr:cytochrome b/b6 domain-containing protein [Aurantimonas sp. Leaf443]KQT85144.1 cytochrome B [Aurantimonas sp. Leaf443]
MSLRAGQDGTALPAPPRYSRAARVLHWVVALLVFAVWPLGFVISFIREDAKLGFYLLHESFGFLVLWAMLARVLVRARTRPPEMIAVSPGERALAKGVHALLYAALLAMPAIGFLATNAHGFPLRLFGLVPIPSPLGKAPEIAPYLSAAHTALAYAILVLLALHLAGVFRHHVLKRDATLQRML